jgi:anti-sigma B factor antagonist
MQFEVEKRENYTLVRVLTEKLDTNNSPDLKSQLVVTSGQGEKNIVLDLSLCKYCDSSGLRAVLVANRLCEDSIGACIISGLQPDVENIFRISMLHTVLLITKTVEEAEDLLKKKETLKSDVKNNDI